MKLQVRRAVPDDLPGILAIEAESLAASGGPAFLERAVSDPNVIVVVVIGGDRRVAGYAVARHAVDDLEIDDLAVAAASRRRGIGGALLDALLDVGSQRGAARVVLEVRASNQAALALYASRGFETVGSRPAYYARGSEDAVVLARSLQSSFEA